MPKIATIKIKSNKTQSGFAIINFSEFDSSIHEEWKESDSIEESEEIDLAPTMADKKSYWIAYMKKQLGVDIEPGTTKAMMQEMIDEEEKRLESISKEDLGKEPKFEIYEDDNLKE